MKLEEKPDDIDSTNDKSRDNAERTSKAGAEEQRDENQRILDLCLDGFARREV